MLLQSSLRLLMLRCLGCLLRLFPATPARSPQRVLVVKPDHLGDVLLLTPALRVLRQHMPNAQITLLVGPWSRDVVVLNPDIDVLLTCPFPGFTRQAQTNRLASYQLLLKTAWWLRAGQYDAALIARDDHWWGALLAALAGIGMRIGYAVPTVAPLLTHSLPHQSDMHVSQQALQLVAALSGQPASTDPPLRAPISAGDRAWAACWFAEHGIAEPCVAIHPGTGGQAKLWLSTRWSQVGSALAARGLRVLVTGGSGEEALVRQVASEMQPPPTMLLGTASIGQLAAVYERCALVLGVDSGPLHLAAAVSTPSLTLFGPSNPVRYGPWGAQHQRSVRSGLWCSPCNELHACPRGTAPSECMSLIGAEHVIALLDVHLDRS